MLLGPEVQIAEPGSCRRGCACALPSCMFALVLRPWFTYGITTSGGVKFSWCVCFVLLVFVEFDARTSVAGLESPDSPYHDTVHVFAFRQNCPLIVEPKMALC